MDWNKVKAVLKKTAAVYWIAVVLIYLVAGQQFRYTAVTTDALSASTVVGEMTDEVTVRQRITVPATRLEGLSLLLGTYERENTGALIVSLEDEQGESWPGRRWIFLRSGMASMPTSGWTRLWTAKRAGP